MSVKLESEKELLKKECIDKGLATSGTIKLLRERLAKYEADREGNLFQNEDNISTIIPKLFSLPADNFFIQAKLANILMYFVKGYLHPLNYEQSDIYRNENRLHDNFHLHPEYIILSKNVVNDFDETLVLIQVILSEEELTKINPSENFVFYNNIIPISRVNKIYFASNSAKNSFISSCEIFPDSFVPVALCEIIPSYVKSEKLNKKPLNNFATKDWTGILSRFDRLMGLMSFLKNTALYYTDKSGEYFEYTNSYFDVLSLINSFDNTSNKENTFFRWIINPEIIEVDNKLARFQFKEILNNIYQNREFDVDYALHLIESSVVFDANNEQNESKENLQHIYKTLLNYKNLKIDYKSLLSQSGIQKSIPLTILIFLIKFPKKNIGHSDKQAFKNFFLSPECNVDKNTAEYIFAVMGLYYGYQNLVKADSLRMDDTYFDSLVQDNAQVKFKLDSFLDRFTIESIFQFCDNGLQKISEPFSFLKFNNVVQPVVKSIPRNSKVLYTDHSFHKLGKIIVKIERISYNALLAQQITELYPAHISQHNHMFVYVSKYFPELLTINSDKLAQLIKEHSVNAHLEELEDIIKLDKKYRFKFKR